jgi:hypothetical protein
VKLNLEASEDRVTPADLTGTNLSGNVNFSIVVLAAVLFLKTLGIPSNPS